jgi:AraC-like DNA-binding protein
MHPRTRRQAALMDSFVRATALSGYLDVTKRLGANPKDLLRLVDLDIAQLANPDNRIPAAAACRLLEMTAERIACPTLGVQIAETRRQFGSGVINLLLAHKRTLREVMMAVIQYRHLLNDAVGVYLEMTGDTATIREEIVTEAGIPMRQSMELAVGVTARHFSMLLGQHWKPRSVHFVHAAPPDLSHHRRLFGCMPVFNSEFNGIVCDIADLNFPNPDADPELVRYAESLADRLNVSGPEAFVQDVRKAIYMLLPLERANVENVADELHLSVRTMQRNLGRMEVSFSQLTDEVRRELALRYMANPRYTMGRVAALLGYSRQSSFTHWFAAQFGVTPSAWRTGSRA